jgi:uncharacterized membrane protein
MTLLFSGVLIWALTHLFKRVMPEARASLDAKIGAGPAKGAIALISLASIVMMIFGFMAAGAQAAYVPPSWGAAVNNSLMVIAVFLMGAGSGKGISPTLLRHPMLTGVTVWSFGHLLANGDVRSIVLFGGLGIWAILNILMINISEGAWERPKAGPLKADIKTVVISLGIFAVIAAIHHFIGPSPFGE